jgi:signal transduction histidine kinase
LARSGDDSTPGVRLTAEDLATIEGGGWLAASLAEGQGGGVVLPLLRAGRLYGLLLLVRRSGAFDSADIAFAGEIARRAALTLDALRLKGEVREALAARDHFLAVAAHELRTPLTALRAHAQLVVRRRETGRLDARWLGTAVAAFERATIGLEQLVADLLDVARLRLDRLPVRRQSFDLVPLVREIAERQRVHLTDRQRLITILPTGDCPAMVDPAHLEQVLTELLNNAAKFSPAGGAIRVGLEMDGPGVRLTVRDEGIGLSPGSAEAIFEPFGRAANAGMRQVRGLGLGLHRCRELVKRNGGHIRAESAGEGAGTEVCCWLPRDGE